MITDTIKFKALKELGYKDEYIITEQGLIIAIANNELVKPCKNQSYRLTLENGKKVQRSIKTLYRKAFDREYAIDELKSLSGEVWRNIDSFGKYYVSNKGRVKSYQGLYAKILTPYKNQRGYLRVDIKTSSRRTYLVHQLVALAFIPNDNPIEKDTIDHIDGNKNNNCVENLRWLSRTDNIRAYVQKQKEQKECIAQTPIKS